jgi:hypothetical protein
MTQPSKAHLFIARKARIVAFATGVLLLLVAGVPGTVLANHDGCGQPISTGAPPPGANDCLFMLRAAVGLADCLPCLCDVDSNGRVAASDALRCLRAAVGQSGVELVCPACDKVTTTTGPVVSSTSSSSTSSTTTTLAVFCTNDSTCALLPDQRCNPNNGLCEKPCSSIDDCKNFFICDEDSQYCVAPPL